jgi:hypothetical protein
VTLPKVLAIPFREQRPAELPDGTRPEREPGPEPAERMVP